MMRLLCIPFLFLSLTCFSQKTTHYVIDVDYVQNDEPLSTQTTYLTLTSDKKGSFPYQLTIKNIVYSNPTTPYFFSSLEPDKNLNVTSTSLLLHNLLPINRSFRFDVRDSEVIVDSVSIRNDLAAQMKVWEIDGEIASNTESMCYMEIKQLIEQLYPSGLDNNSKKISSAPIQVGSKLYSFIKKDKNTLRLAAKDTSSASKYEGEIAVDKNTFFVTEATHSFEIPANDFASTARVRMVDTPFEEPKISATYTDMLVMNSFLSRALYTHTTLDSNKVMTFIAKLDSSPYSHDQTFLKDKLSLLQRIKNRDAYDVALANAPIALLAGTHHLNNILYRDDNISIEKFGQIVPLMNEAPRYDWFQNTFYQDLNKDGDHYEEKLELMVNGLTDEISLSSYPMAI